MATFANINDEAMKQDRVFLLARRNMGEEEASVSKVRPEPKLGEAEREARASPGADIGDITSD